MFSVCHITAVCALQNSVNKNSAKRKTEITVTIICKTVNTFQESYPQIHVCNFYKKIPHRNYDEGFIFCLILDDRFPPLNFSV